MNEQLISLLKQVVMLGFILVLFYMLQNEPISYQIFAILTLVVGLAIRQLSSEV